MGTWSVQRQACSIMMRTTKQWVALGSLRVASGELWKVDRLEAVHGRGA